MATKLLLTEDVEALGRKGDVVTVKPGFARNFLLPEGKALVADKNSLRRQEALRIEREKQGAVDKKESEAQALKLKEVSISFNVKVDPQGHMYGSVSAMDLHAKLEKEHGIVLGKRDIQLKHALKTVGSHKINVKLKEDVATILNVEIVGEGYTPPVFKAAAEQTEKTEEVAE